MTNIENAEEELRCLKAAIELAADDVLVFFRDGERIYPGLFCSDTFAYACADAEDVDWTALPEILTEYRTGDWPTTVERIAAKRKVRPLPQIEQAMERARGGMWRLEQENEALRAELAALRAKKYA